MIHHIIVGILMIINFVPLFIGVTGIFRTSKWYMRYCWLALTAWSIYNMWRLLQ